MSRNDIAPLIQHRVILIDMQIDYQFVNQIVQFAHFTRCKSTFSSIIRFIQYLIETFAMDSEKERIEEKRIHLRYIRNLSRVTTYRVIVTISRL